VRPTVVISITVIAGLVRVSPFGQLASKLLSPPNIDTTTLPGASIRLVTVSDYPESISTAEVPT
jgi:hypothetical protein